jgi:hypothetical protein
MKIKGNLMKTTTYISTYIAFGGQGWCNQVGSMDGTFYKVFLVYTLWEGENIPSSMDQAPIPQFSDK